MVKFFIALFSIFILFTQKQGYITIKLTLYAIYLVNLSGNMMICLELLLLW